MNFNDLERFCMVCDKKFGVEDVLQHSTNEHLFNTINSIFNVLSQQQQSKILDQIVDVREKKMEEVN